MRIVLSAFCIILAAQQVGNAGASQIAPTPPRTTIPVIKTKRTPSFPSPAAATNDISITGYFTNQAGQGLSAQDLANALVGQGVTISNVTSNCADNAAGTFVVNGDVGIGLSSGIILSTGTIDNVVGPNQASDTSWDNEKPGDTDLDTLIPDYQTYDACILEFDFIPQSPTVSFKYAFSSEEYNEFVGTSFNDVFGFFIDGVNCATLNSSSISINNVNLDTNSTYYVDNEAGTYNLEMDGFTRVLTCSAAVQVGQAHHLKLAIADAGDPVWDANVFLATQSLVSTPYGVSLSPATLTGSTNCGVRAAYELDLKNLGSYNDSFTLALSSAQWPSVFATTGTGTATFGPLSSLATTKVNVYVTPPVTGCSGTDTVTVTATSAGSPSTTATASISTTASGAPLVKIDTTPYATLQAAYDAAAVSGDVVMLKEGDPGAALGTLTAGAAKSVTIRGGYNAAYTDNSGSTVVLGPVTMAYGTVGFDNVWVK